MHEDPPEFDDVDDGAEQAEAGDPVPSNYRCGFAAIVGRPNVGKSTLLNALLHRKVSIVSPKPQTTRHRILGILTRPEEQIIFVDTPGIHSSARRAMNRHMNRAALSSLADADINLFVVESLSWSEEDQRVLDALKQQKRPIILVLSKVDKVQPRERMLPFIQEMNRRAEFVEVVPLSALKKSNLEQLPSIIAKHLPLSPPHFPPDQVTDRSPEFQAAEIVREKLTLRLRQELPYGLTVALEQFKEEDGRLLVNAVIWVERTGQKAIVIGQGGEQLKEVGRSARIEMSNLFGRPVHLELWVKVKENWSDNEMALKQLGYEM
ncbi:GTPase Era [Steroidobacter agaridevorans]|uniref:GTPase Era n=1 Tax=Steroidobacter agaridevorans TaxID=2695856 RepID=UPI001323BCCD|nr:GTPase Era [Steroidobacter agaridevorans]GFE87905.1 GTPase Era [Steroidobacter agaridevorans]